MKSGIVKRFFDLFGGGGSGVAYTGDGGRQMRALATTTAGPTINEQTVLTIPAFLHAIRLYGQTIGSLDWNLVQIEDRGRKIARSHPIHRLLHDDPNEFQLASSFRETVIGHAITHGNGYAFIERNGNFRPTALLPLMPWYTYPIRTNGRLQYVTMVNGSKQILEPYEVMHVAGFSVNGLTGVPLVRLMAETLGLTKAEESYAAAYFGNGANYGGMIEVPGTISPEAMKNLRDSFHQNQGGLGNAFRWIFLEEGMKANRSEADADKAQLIESRSFQLAELARVTGLPPHLLYDLSRSTNNNIEWQGIEAVTYAFRPWANKLCQEARRKLLYESEQDSFEPTIDLKPLMQGDAKTQAERDQIKFNTASITPNEIRAKDGLNPIDGGDQLFVNVAVLPLNLAIEKAMAQIAAAKAAIIDPTDEAALAAAAAEGVDNEPAEPNAEPTPAGDAKFFDGPAASSNEVDDVNAIGGASALSGRSLRPVVADVVARLIRRESKAVAGAVKRSAGDGGPDLSKWADGYAVETRAFAVSALQPVIDTLAAIGVKRDVAAIAGGFASRTLADVRALAGSSPADRGDEMELMIEGWQAGRLDALVNELIGAD